jgi:hypothetical protein
MTVTKTRPDVSQDAPANDAHTPRPLTFAENLILTIRVLGVLGLIGGVLWAAKLWKAAS